MNFQLDPPSGYSDSYLDIRFIVKFDYADKAEVKLFNEITKSEIEILGISSGYILEETTAVAEESVYIEGFINIFNKDKMNNLLSRHVSVPIKCELTLHKNGNTITESNTVEFYNQSQSIDGNVIPFDIEIINSSVNIDKCDPLKLQITCDSEQHYELCLKQKNSPVKLTFEVQVKRGLTEIEIPAAVLYHDLGLNKTPVREFFMYWVKFEGIDYGKYINRQNILINNSKISIKSTKTFMSLPQSRMGPTSLLNEEFVVSSRYLVHTHKRYSGLSPETDLKRMNYVTRFFHEAQNMNMVDESVSLFVNKKNKDNPMLETKKAIHSQAMQDYSSRLIRSFPTPQQKKFLDATLSHPNIPEKAQTMQAPNKDGGCGCSRKK